MIRLNSLNIRSEIWRRSLITDLVLNGDLLSRLISKTTSKISSHSQFSWLFESSNRVRSYSSGGNRQVVEMHLNRRIYLIQISEPSICVSILYEDFKNYLNSTWWNYLIEPYTWFFLLIQRVTFHCLTVKLASYIFLN